MGRQISKSFPAVSLEGTGGREPSGFRRKVAIGKDGAATSSEVEGDQVYIVGFEPSKVNYVAPVRKKKNKYSARTMISKVSKKKSKLSKIKSKMSTKQSSTSVAPSSDTETNNSKYINRTSNNENDDEDANKQQQENIVQLLTKGVWLLEPIAANVCQATLVIRIEDTGKLPKKIVNSKIGSSLDVMSSLGRFFERNGLAVDKDIREAFVSSIPRAVGSAYQVGVNMSGLFVATSDERRAANATSQTLCVRSCERTLARPQACTLARTLACTPARSSARSP